MKKNRLFWFVAIVGFILDQVSKFWADHYFSEIGETIPIWQDVFHFTYVHNTGAAFSLLTDQVHWLRWLSLTVTIGLMIFVWLSSRLPKLEQMGYGLVLAGAAGNGMDRFLFGFVIDFFDVRLIQFPVFNIADICINIGVACLIMANFPYFKGSRRPKNRNPNHYE